MGRKIARTVGVCCEGCRKEYESVATESGNWVVACPRCGREHDASETKPRYHDGREVHKGNPNFYGQRSFSIVSGCHRLEVPLLKRIMGPDFSSCILDDGTVRFRNAKQQEAWVKRFEAARAMNAADPGCFDRKGAPPEVPC